MLFCDLRYMLLHIKVFHIKHATRGEWGGPPTLSWKSKKCPGFGEKGPDFVHPEVRFTIENIVLRVSRTKSSNIFCCRTIFLDFLRKCLLKHPNFKNSPLPWTISCCAPAYIWYKQSDFCSLELYWQYLQKSWWSSGMIPEKVTWVRFPARINTVYSKLPPINDLFLKILNQT